MLYIIFHFLVRNIGCGIGKAILDLWELYELVDDRVDFSCVHMRYFIGYVYHICLQDTIQSTQRLCLLWQAMLLPMPLRPVLRTLRSGTGPSVSCSWRSAPPSVSLACRPAPELQSMTYPLSSSSRGVNRDIPPPPAPLPRYAHVTKPGTCVPTPQNISLSVNKSPIHTPT